MQPYTLYIGDCRISFVAETPSADHLLLVADDNLSVSRAKVIKKVESGKFIAILTPSPEQSFDLFASQFHCVEAAGGVVEDEHNRLLMIRLRGRWDLPKGHVESHENSREAALREVEEETGVVATTTAESPLCTTYHAYDTYGRWELKRCRWWRMRYLQGSPKPQHDEGIEMVKWCDRNEVSENLKQSYKTVERVIAYREQRFRD